MVGCKRERGCLPGMAQRKNMDDWSKGDVIATLAGLAFVGLYTFSPGFSTFSLLFSVSISLLFAVAAWALKGVSISGAVTGAMMAFIFADRGGPDLFVLLLVVFAITFGASKLRRLRISGPPPRRTSRQVVANLAVPVAVLVSTSWNPHASALAFPVIFSALAELSADTVSSEIGEAFGRPTYLLTSMRATEPGVNGGISFAGTMAGCVAAVLVTGTAVCLYPMISRMGIAVWIPVIVGSVTGMFVDSLLGATLERRGWLNNDLVNLVGTATAAAIAAMLAHKL